MFNSASSEPDCLFCCALPWSPLTPRRCCIKCAQLPHKLCVIIMGTQLPRCHISELPLRALYSRLPLLSAPNLASFQPLKCPACISRSRKNLPNCFFERRGQGRLFEHSISHRAFNFSQRGVCMMMQGTFCTPCSGLQLQRSCPLRLSTMWLTCTLSTHDWLPTP